MKPLVDKYQLPDNILVSTTKSKKGGYTVTLPEYPGCITYAENVGELIEVVNDALLTYFKVPRKEAKLIDFLYVPDSSDDKNVKQVSNKYVRYTPPVFQYV